MILVVEDSVVVRNLVVQGLSQWFMVVSAGDGREALSILETSEVDLSLTDLDMPLMSGRELTRQVRRSDKHSAKPIPRVLSADQDGISISRRALA